LAKIKCSICSLEFDNSNGGHCPPCYLTYFSGGLPNSDACIAGLAAWPWHCTTALAEHPLNYSLDITPPLSFNPSLHPSPYHSTPHPITPPFTLSLHPSPFTIHPITPPYHSTLTLHPITPPYHSILHPSTPPFAHHSTPHPITPPFTLSLHPSLDPLPYHSILDPINPPIINHAAETPVVAGHRLNLCRSNHCTSPCDPTHSAMIDRFLACIAPSKHTPWQAVAGITLHQFATSPNIAHQVWTVLLRPHEGCHASQQVLANLWQDPDAASN